MNQVVDVKNEKPLYLQLVDAIKARVNQNFWHLGMMIPSEHKLAKEFNISAGTVKKALSILVQDGVLFRRQGKGTFVSGPDFSNSFIRFFRYGSVANSKNEIPGSNIVSMRIDMPGKRVAKLLKLTKNAKVIKIHRIRTLRNVPIVVEDIHVPYKRFKGLEQMDLEDRLLYPIYQKEFDTPIIWADEYLQSGTADKDTAKKLGIRSQAPLIRIERIARCYGDIPVECRFSMGRGEQFRYHIVVR